MGSQEPVPKLKPDRHSLSVFGRLGGADPSPRFSRDGAKAGGGAMAKVIEFYIPSTYIPKQPKWIAPEDRGKVLEFEKVKKTA